MQILNPVIIGSLEELREYVHAQLCHRENLLQSQSPIREESLLRQGLRCAIQYIVQGPRQVRLMAIWDADRNEILFYDSHGTRYQKAPLRYRLSRAA